MALCEVDRGFGSTYIYIDDLLYDEVRVRKYGEANNMVWCSRIWNNDFLWRGWLVGKE